MNQDFFSNSKCIIVGPKPANRSSIRKMVTTFGCDNRSIETCITVEESYEPLNNNNFNVVIFDDDCKDLQEVDKLFELFYKRLKDEENSLVIILSSDSNLSIFQKYLDNKNSILVSKPYTIGSFISEIDNFLMKQKEEYLVKQQNEKKQKKRITRTKKAYLNFSKYMNKVSAENLEDDFFMLCKDFLDSLDKTIDYKSLSKILTEGILSRRFKELNFFVEGWINSAPIEAKYIPDISRVLLFNNHFELFDKMKSDDKDAMLAIGVGMVISASVICKDETKNELVIKYIQTGVVMTCYKPIVVCSALETLLEINATKEASEILEDSRAHLTDDTDPQIREILTSIENRLYADIPN